MSETKWMVFSDFLIEYLYRMMCIPSGMEPSCLLCFTFSLSPMNFKNCLNFCMCVEITNDNRQLLEMMHEWLESKQHMLKQKLFRLHVEHRSNQFEQSCYGWSCALVSQLDKNIQIPSPHQPHSSNISTPQTRCLKIARALTCPHISH